MHRHKAPEWQRAARPILVKPSPRGYKLRMSPVLVLALTVALSACASAGSARPTVELYQELVIARVIGFRCNDSAGLRFDARIAALRPWLDRQLGSGKAEAMLGQQYANLGDTDFTRCPTREEVRSTAGSIERQLSALERRARVTR